MPRNCGHSRKWKEPAVNRMLLGRIRRRANTSFLIVPAWSAPVSADFKVRLGKFVVWKNCFQIPVDSGIDRKVMKDLVRARLSELDWSPSSFWINTRQLMNVVDFHQTNSTTVCLP